MALSPPFRLAIAGASGRMGRALIQCASGDDALRVAAGLCAPDDPALGRDLGALAGLDPLGVYASADPHACAQAADLWIDFTSPAASASHARLLADAPIAAALFGATGLDEAQERAIAELARSRIVVRARNFSLGVHVLAALTRKAASLLNEDWDIEISETHHRDKRDAPSGTALMLGEAAAEGRGGRLDALRLSPRQGLSEPRPRGGIGIAALRGGGVIGDHEAAFLAREETIHLSHRALDRAVFARGALYAAKWAAGQAGLKRAPGLYSMGDVLGL